ncbi:hypothetical protein A1O1_08482 [Capronia coronata CBS 617.96]|uniref:Uncharacterized protein n=1 Tax=Capronia coronata CBS 617.96 TaxID=1182541 RepID=W9XJJ3_9EURO|nr:uncharacterized protein A1O1_08482 [Capronia coronata CBS 617.96]EXJ80338.1 hypothetical protein A1O1_08482 [Capronia coronata CBS 617.96]
MDHLPFFEPRRPTGPMGFLNYPAEIMNRIYHELFVDDSHVLLCLFPTNPTLRSVTPKQSFSDASMPADDMYWSRLLNGRYYADSNGRSAQFLRVCRKVWLEGTPVLYGNLALAMRTIANPDACIKHTFRRNARYILASAKVMYPSYHRPSSHSTEGWKLIRVVQSDATGSLKLHLKRARSSGKPSAHVGWRRRAHGHKRRSLSF